MNEDKGLPSSDWLGDPVHQVLDRHHALGEGVHVYPVRRYDGKEALIIFAIGTGVGEIEAAMQANGKRISAEEWEEMRRNTPG